eukprot:CAMPEP_0206575704 /NCGR_PEP_ID=MMETSP0325_2-20121206/30255_1 /ASSEMBLY_ACC=CAM_ASM_000347 /TAXON_ID=2866 /ORGANISM="Crypthecodinium cohnii, Strain Seligo" /LENGTH=177 /DNA_ID=CAMNT_0054080661 /DNA_START=20 /DNA_END=553 /DNA_ORIENTATION=+
MALCKPLVVFACTVLATLSACSLQGCKSKVLRREFSWEVLSSSRCENGGPLKGIVYEATCDNNVRTVTRIDTKDNSKRGYVPKIEGDCKKFFSTVCVDAIRWMDPEIARSRDAAIAARQQRQREQQEQLLLKHQQQQHLLLQRRSESIAGPESKTSEVEVSGDGRTIQLHDHTSSEP